jgi:hypothetical protein
MPPVSTLCGTVSERPRFYARQIITADDLNLGQDYFIDKLRLHNRCLHGWGVVCGATLDYTTKPWMILVRAGVVLGPYGDELVICQDVCFDLRTRCTSSTPQAQDPCSDAWQPAPPANANTGAANTTVYVVIESAPVQARPVRVKSAGCGCQENPCEASRWQDGYQICVLETLPASHTGDPVPHPIEEGAPPACPPAPADPWVVLGAVTVGPDGTVSTISYANRRQVVSFAPCWWRPTDPGPNPNHKS